MLYELIEKNRSYRSFDPMRRVSGEELRYFVSCARITPSAANRQCLRYRLCASDADMARVLPHLHWAAALPERHFPPEGHEPPACIVLCHDKRAAENVCASSTDVGIAAQTILLAAAEAGLGGCMIANFAPDALAASLALPEFLTPVLVVALGLPDETVVLEDAAPGAATAYYRDAQDRHHVPKRTLDELIV